MAEASSIRGTADMPDLPPSMGVTMGSIAPQLLRREIIGD